MKGKIIQVLNKILPANIMPEVFVPEKEDFGHYSTNAAFLLAKIKKQSPLSAAEELIALIKKNAPAGFFEKIEMAKPGFINFWLHENELLKNLNQVLKNPKKWAHSNKGKGKTIIVEYFQPNVAKIPHIGHLRSAVIGDALKRLLLSQGYKIVSDTHIGDWGTQFGILLFAYKSLSKDRKKQIKNNPIEGLSKLYLEENQQIENEPNRREKAKLEFAKLEAGDKENRKIWQWMVKVSMKKFTEIIKQLNLLKFEEHRGESFYEKSMLAIVKLALKKGIAKKEKDGAIIADLTKGNLDKPVLIKSDNASTYLLRDLATIKYRTAQWKFWKNLYVVDVRQELHFKQVFHIAKLLGFNKGENKHIEFGFLSLKEGAMSTRKGNVIALQDVIKNIISRATEVMKEKNPGLKNANEIAKAIGIGALKYFDLSHHRSSNIIFDEKEALQFEGSTGPYLQYTNARLTSILRKSKIKISFVKTLLEIAPKEQMLLVTALRLPEIIQEALVDYSPNILANYLLDLAKRANEWYHGYPVLQELNPDKKTFRLALVFVLSLTLSKGLDLLGIKPLKKM